MAISLKHSKISSVEDGENEDLVRPSDWNAEHTLRIGDGHVLVGLGSNDPPNEVVATANATANTVVTRDASARAKFAAPAANGDALIKGAQLTVSEMPRSTSGLFLRANGAASNPGYAGWTANKLLLGAGASNAPTEIDVPAPGMWTYLAQLSWNNENTAKTTDSLTFYDLYKIIVCMRGSTIASAGCSMRFNGDTGSNYTINYIDTDRTIKQQVSSSLTPLGSIGSTMLCMIDMLIANHNGNSFKPFHVRNESDVSGQKGLSGYWYRNGALTTVSFTPPQNAYGKLNVYGMNL